MPESDRPTASARIAAIANNVLAPGLALLMLHIARHSGVVSFTLRRNTGTRTALISGALVGGVLLGGAFFPRLSAWGRRSGNRAWRVIAAIWVAAAPLTALFGLHAYVFNEPLRVFANLFLGMALAPAYQLFFSRFPVRWRGTCFGACLGVGALCWELFLIAQTASPPPGPESPFHPLLAHVYLVHAASLVIFAALCIYALTTLPAPAQDEKPHFAPLPGQYDRKALVRALMASTCIVFFIGGIIDVGLAPAFPSPPQIAFRIALSISAVMAGPIAGWLLDKRPDRIFRRFLPVCCGLFILTPALAALDAAHALHVVLQPAALAVQIAFFALCSVAAAGLAPDAGAAARYACSLFAIRAAATVSANMVWHRMLAAGTGPAVFAVTLLAFAAYRLGWGMGLSVDRGLPLPEPDAPPAKGRFAAFAHTVLAPGLALFMLSVAGYAGVASFAMQGGGGGRTLLTTALVSLGFFLGGAFFPRLLEGGGSGARLRRFLAALWLTAILVCLLPGFTSYVESDTLRSLANFTFGTAFAPVYLLFFSRFPTERRGVWFGASVSVGVLSWSILCALRPDGESSVQYWPAQFTSFHPRVYLIYAVFLALAMVVCAYALLIRPGDAPAERKRFAPVPGKGSGAAIVLALMGMACATYLLNGVVGAKLTPVLSFSSVRALPAALTFLASLAAPATGWILDKRPECFFRFVLPAGCLLLILSPSLAALDDSHTLHTILQPVMATAQFAFFTAFSVALAGQAPNAAKATWWGCAVYGMRIVSIFMQIIWGKILAVGSGPTVFVTTLLAFFIYKVGSGIVLGAPADERHEGVETAEGGIAVSPDEDNKELPAQDKTAAVAAFLATGGLTPREMETAILLLDGKVSHEISVALSISEWTVKKHATNIYRKFGVDGRFDFLRLFVDESDNPIHNKK